jgi:hypothetical protein
MAPSTISFVLVIAAISMPAGAQTGAPFLRPEPVVPLLEPACPTAGLSRIPVRCWTGQKFIILPKTIGSRSKDYPEIERFAPRYGHPAYGEIAGKVVMVTKVVWEEYSLSPNSNGWVVAFKTGENGPFFTTTSTIHPGGGKDDAVVGCFGLARDILSARRDYLGKSYWPVLSALPALDGSDQTSPTPMVSLNKFEPTTVVDVLASPIAAVPTRIVVKNAVGQEGYFDIAMSGTNRGLHKSKDGERFSDFMSESDPKLAHDWSTDIWKAIESGTVAKGMTMEQVRLSLGDPIDISRATIAGQMHEQWVYTGGRYLYFEGGILNATGN